MRGRWPLTAGIIVLLAVISGLTAVFRGQRRPVVTPVNTAAPPSTPSEIVLSGTIEARQTIRIFPATNGFVEQMMAAPGEDVFEGEMLARIRNPQLEDSEHRAEAEALKARAQATGIETDLLTARLEASRTRSEETRAKAELERSEKDYLRQKQLDEQGAVARIVFEKAEHDYRALQSEVETLGHAAVAAEDRIASLTAGLEAARNAAQAKEERLDGAKADLGAGEVRAPANGIVLERRAKTGDRVQAKDATLYVIAIDVNQLRIVASPAAGVAARLKPGQPAQVEAGEAPGPIAGAIGEVSPGRVTVEFVSPLPAIRPGMPGKAKILAK